MRTITAVTDKAGPVNKIRDIITPRTCLTFYPHENVKSIVRNMHGHHSGAAGVVDVDCRFIGLITEREVLRRVFRMVPETAEQKRFEDEGKPLESLTAWDIMIAGPDSMTDDMDVEKALAVITEKGYRYMPVVDSKNDRKLVGIVGERELFMHTQEKNRRALAAKDSLLSYFMHHEPYGIGADLN